VADRAYRLVEMPAPTAPATPVPATEDDEANVQIVPLLISTTFRSRNARDFNRR
jgi:hypothetical protein